MTRSRLLLAVAGVLAGAAVLFVVLGVVFNLVLVAAAVPFGLATYLLWNHATGRLEARVHRVPFDPDRSPRDRARRGAAGSGSARGRRPRDAGAGGSMTRREALDVLGLAPGADERAVRRAYRERVKAVHPDADEGDEAAFYEVRAAYDRLRGAKR